MSEVSMLPRPHGDTIAYGVQTPVKPAKVSALWLGGFRSTMDGTKADFFARAAQKMNIGFTRFDYFAHGKSSGAFREATISRWLADSQAVLGEITQGPQILIGSSMGGWLALLLALACPQRVAGLLLIAPAVDMTRSVMWKSFSYPKKARLKIYGEIFQPAAYPEEDPVLITKKLIDDGARHTILHGPRSIKIDVPVRIVHGMRDASVPFKLSLQLMDCLAGQDTQALFCKQGDHRLSTPHDLQTLFDTLKAMVKNLTPS